MVGDNSDNMAGQWRSMKEACDILGLSRRTIQRRIKSGGLESKLEDGRRFILVTQVGQERQNDSDMSQPGLVQQLQKENERLHQQLQAKDEQIAKHDERIERLEQLLAMEKRQNQQLLEYQLQPFWRRWIKRKALPPPGDMVDMEPGSDEDPHAS